MQRMKNRALKAVLAGTWVMEGAGVKLRRIFSFGDPDDYIH